MWDESRDYCYNHWFERIIKVLQAEQDKFQVMPLYKIPKIFFRLHILLIFGNYSIKYLNDNKDFVLRELTKLSRLYANIKIVKSYINQVFEIAELLDYIEYNRIQKVIHYVSEPKKQKLKEVRELEGESMTAQELIQWIDTVNEDYKNKIIIM